MLTFPLFPVFMSFFRVPTVWEMCVQQKCAFYCKKGFPDGKPDRILLFVRIETVREDVIQDKFMFLQGYMNGKRMV